MVPEVEVAIFPYSAYGTDTPDVASDSQRSVLKLNVSLCLKAAKTGTWSVHFRGADTVITALSVPPSS